MSRARCDCGRLHERFELGGATVTGCPKCLREGPGSKAMGELITAAKDALRMSKSVVRLNAEKDANYAPYCLRCDTMRRMNFVEPFFWRCGYCGSEHDERGSDAVESQPAAPRPDGMPSLQDLRDMSMVCIHDVPVESDCAKCEELASGPRETTRPAAPNDAMAVEHPEAVAAARAFLDPWTEGNLPDLAIECAGEAYRAAANESLVASLERVQRERVDLTTPGEGPYRVRPPWTHGQNPPPEDGRWEVVDTSGFRESAAGPKAKCIAICAALNWLSSPPPTPQDKT